MEMLIPENHAATRSERHRPQTPRLPGSNGVEKGDFVTHGDLLRLAQRRQCRGIHSEPVIALCHPEKNFWVFKATVYKSPKCRGFVGYGDAHPGNVSPLIFNDAEMPMAESRAVNRALRKAHGVALCLIEELPPWPLFARADSRLAPHPSVPTAVSERRSSVRGPNESGMLSATGQRFGGLGPKNFEENSNLQGILQVEASNEARRMARKAAWRRGWDWGERAREEGQRDVQPVAHKKGEGCDLGSGADVDRLPAPGQFACATGCTTPRNRVLPTAPVTYPP